MRLNERFGRLLIPGLIGIFLLCFVWLANQAMRVPGIPFLPSSSGADWIIFPKPPEATLHKVVPVAVEFQRPFTLQSPPRSADLSCRWFANGSVSINGSRILSSSSNNWKNISRIDISMHLRAGSNFISAMVTNATAPPALWLRLSCPECTISTGEGWAASIAGSSFAPAVRADAAPSVRDGNPLHGRERIAESLKRNWLILVLVTGLSALLAVVAPLRRLDMEGGKCAPRIASAFAWVRGNFFWVVPLIIGLVWLVLFANNIPQLAALFGFDRDGHLQYIDYILTNQTLPLADAGWQMYQPPLFYILSSLLVAPFGWTANSDGALLLLRAFAGITGLAHAVLILFCLRRLFPDRKATQLFGALLASFVPANLYISHHITNENLSALLVTTSFWCILRVGSRGGSPLRWSALGGFALGLAMLTKFSALLAIPALLLALFWKIALPSGTDIQGPSPATALRCVGLFMGVFLLSCGWHYARVWFQFGNPLIGNWDPRLPFAWWQDPGYRTASWFSGLGSSYNIPLFSSLSSFGDGLLSTLWTDGLCGGSARMDFRPQWNYDLLDGAFLLGTVWTVLVVLGFWRLLRRDSRSLTGEGILVIGVSAAFAFGISYMTLHVPSYGQVKFFYALPALLPFCILAATGWDWVTSRGRVWEALLNMLLGTWVLLVLCGFWIRSSSPATHEVRGIGLADEGRFAEAQDSFSRSKILGGPTSATAGLAAAMDRQGQREEARKLLEAELQIHPGDPSLLIQLGTILALQGNYSSAVTFLQQALARQPDHPLIAQKLAVCLNRLGRHRDAIQVCRDGLRVTPYSPDLHYWIANSAVALNDVALAIGHLQLAAELRQTDPATWQEFAQALQKAGQDSRAIVAYGQALSLKGDAPDILNNAAWLLASSSDKDVRNGKRAVQLAEQACDLTGYQEPMILGTLAAAQAQAGNFATAADTATKAAQLATASGQKNVAEANQKYLQLYYSKGLALP